MSSDLRRREKHLNGTNKSLQICVKVHFANSQIHDARRKSPGEDQHFKLVAFSVRHG